MFFSCGTSITSVSHSSIRESLYGNTLIEIPYANCSERFSKKLKKRIEKLYRKRGEKVDVLCFYNRGYQVTQHMVDSIIEHNNKDLLVIFKSKNVSYKNKGVRDIKYDVIALSTKDKKEIWKARLKAKTSLGHGFLAHKVASAFYSKIHCDHLYDIPVN